MENISLINRKINLINNKNNNNNNPRNANDLSLLKNNNSNNSLQNCNINIKNKEINNNNNLKRTKDEKINKNLKINNYNFKDGHLRNNLPHIVSPRKRKEFNLQEYSLNNIENYNIVPIILPNIENIQKVKNIRYQSIKKNYRKKSSTAKENY